MFYLDGKTRKRYQLGSPFTYGDINYTKQGATHDTFIGLGFKQIVPQPRPNDKYYIVSGPDRYGRYSSTPRDVEQLKVNGVKEHRSIANQLLTPTDWYYARFVELGEAEAVPQEVADYRAAVRAVFDARRVAVEACETIEDLQAVVLEDWPESPEL